MKTKDNNIEINEPAFGMLAGDLGATPYNLRKL